MYLYHGTNSIRGKQIIKDLLIKSNVDRIYTDMVQENLNTTGGYVYLDKNFYSALGYAINAGSYEKDLIESYNSFSNDFLYIFKIDIDPFILEEDEDEKKNDTQWQNSNRAETSFWVSHDIDLLKSSTQYLYIDYGRNRKLVNNLKNYGEMIYYQQYKTEEQKLIFAEDIKQFHQLFQWINI